MKRKILLVEDELHLRETIELNLILEKYEVISVGDGKSALETFNGMPFDLIILDVMLPEIDGYTLCQTIRTTDSSIPILFLTAKGNSRDRIHGLKLGADDYLPKPFDLEEFLLRVKNLLKRTGRSNYISNGEFEFGECKVSFLNYEKKITK